MRLDLYQNASADEVLAVLGLTKDDVERYRGCGVQDGEIIIHARTGGGNREYHPNEKLTSHPNYLRDQDDDFDCTYADYFFSIPEDKKEIEATENKEARAVLGDAPTAIGLMFGDEKAKKNAQERLDKITH